jgi:uncharacterized protein (TIGR02284 family)
MDLEKRFIELVELLTDSQRGLAGAAARVDDERVREMLLHTGNGRAPMIEMLGYELARSGRETPMQGTTEGAFHRAWMGIRDRVAPDIQRLLHECERGEEYLLRKYDEVIAAPNLPEPVRKILEKHRRTIDESLAHIQSYNQQIQHERKK